VVVVSYSLGGGGNGAASRCQYGSQTWNCDPGIQRPEDPVDLVTLFYNELQMLTYVADKRLQWARGLPVFIAVWRLHASEK